MSLLCIFLNYHNKKNRITEEELLLALEGNLCRCTGYVQIRNAAIEFMHDMNSNRIKYSDVIKKEVSNAGNDILAMMREKYSMVFNYEFEDRCYFRYNICKDIDDMFYYLLDGSHAKIINGGTVIMVDRTSYMSYTGSIIDISRLNELNIIDIVTDEKQELEKSRLVLHIGGSTKYIDLLESKKIQEFFPYLSKVINRIGSLQIRNIGTVAGNIANASPVGDMTCFLLCIGTELQLLSKDRSVSSKTLYRRIISLEKFYTGYKETMMEKNEIIYQISIELPDKDEIVSFIKTAKRKTVDISTVNSAMRIRVEDNRIVSCRISFGGVYIYPILAYKCMEYLIDKEPNEEIIEKASEIAMNEFSTIDDVRSSSEYRKLLIRNHIIKHFNENVLNKIV